MMSIQESYRELCLRPESCHHIVVMLTLICYIYYLCKPYADGVVVIAISLYPEVPGSIPERGKKRRFL